MRKFEALLAVLDEIKRAESLHPYWPDDIIHQSAIVGEESGELIQAALDCKYKSWDMAKIRTEAIHTAATAIRLLINLEAK
jgi:hypothetical protein